MRPSAMLLPPNSTPSCPVPVDGDASRPRPGAQATHFRRQPPGYRLHRSYLERTATNILYRRLILAMMTEGPKRGRASCASTAWPKSCNAAVHRPGRSLRRRGRFSPAQRMKRSVADPRVDRIRPSAGSGGAEDVALPPGAPGQPVCARPLLTRRGTWPNRNLGSSGNCWIRCGGGAGCRFLRIWRGADRRLSSRRATGPPISRRGNCLR